MRNPHAPFVELGLYFADGNGKDDLRAVLRYLFNLGARARIAHIRDCKTLVLSRGGVETGRDRHLRTNEELWELMSNEDVTPTRVTIENGTNAVPGSREIVVQLPIDPQLTTLDHNPVAIWIEGEAFSYPTGDNPRRAVKVGRKIVSAFRDLMTSLRPSYGAITVDYGLPCPADLQLDPRTLAFRDFYLSSDFVGDDVLARVPELQPNAYHERVSDGLITLCYGPFAPCGIDVSSTDAERLSTAVGEMILANAKRQN